MQNKIQIELRSNMITFDPMEDKLAVRCLTGQRLLGDNLCLVSMKKEFNTAQEYISFKKATGRHWKI